MRSLTAKVGSFKIMITIYGAEIWKDMGMFRLHVYYKHYYIFHWCDLCVAPRIKGVNL